MNGDQAEFIAELFTLLNGSPDRLDTDYQLDESNWDSIMVISSMALIDKHFNVIVPGEALLSCRSVRDVLRLIPAESRGGQ
jgi:acyl carrier protein